MSIIDGEKHLTNDEWSRLRPITNGHILLKRACNCTLYCGMD